MEIFKGFAHIGQLVNNSPDEVSPVGEISSESLSFMKDKKLFTSGDYPNLTLLGFTQTVDGVETEFAGTKQQLILKAASWTYARANNGTITVDVETFRQTFVAAFGTELDLISSGVHVKYNTNRYCPEFITIAPKNESSTITWKIWFSDQAFLNQYDDFVIIPVTPILDLDSMFDTYETVLALTTPADIQGMNDRANAAKGNYPYTALRTWAFDWVDPSNRDARIPTYWLTLHYGERGNNLDSVKEAIREHILANSDKPREDWAVIFPDIFTSTEVIVIPAFNLIAVPNRARETGVYSPTISLAMAEHLALKLSVGVDYNDEHIKSVIEVTNCIYKSIALVTVGGPENKDGVDKFSLRYPDYISVPTTHVDFGYMAEETRDFVLMIVEMVRLADELTPSMSLPRGFNRIVRDGITFVSANFKGFLWLVASRTSVMENL